MSSGSPGGGCDRLRGAPISVVKPAEHRLRDDVRRVTRRRRNDERDLFARSRGLIRIALVVALWAVALTPRWSFSAPGGLREPSPSPTDLVMGGGFSPSRPEAPGGQTPPCQYKCEDHPDVESDTDPIDIHRGEFVETRPDVFIPNRGFDLAVAFTYRSRSAINSHWGYGWDMNYNRRLRPLSNGDMVPTCGRRRPSSPRGTLRGRRR